VQKVCNIPFFIGAVLYVLKARNRRMPHTDSMCIYILKTNRAHGVCNKVEEEDRRFCDVIRLI
jgi:hypothetical protein